LLSAACKLLLAVASTFSWITLVIGLDRIGKGIRTAPRDALISLYTPPNMFGTAFGVHRAMDAAGALLGPLVAFALLAQIAGEFRSLWMVSSIVAFLGVAALWLLVPRGEGVPAAAKVPEEAPTTARLPRRFFGLAMCGTGLALVTVSDGFIYLMLQQKTGTEAGMVPLFFVATAASYMLFSIPVGVLADRIGRAGVFVCGYVVLGGLYVLLLSSSAVGLAAQAGCLLLLGLYYASTEGVLMAVASGVVQRHRRATGLAILATCIGLGKLASSVSFGWLSQVYGTSVSVAVFSGALLVVLVGSALWLRSWTDAAPDVVR
jgi:MFS family permease